MTESGEQEAPLVLLVHGSMDRGTGMRGVVRRLVHDFRVVVYDRRGYGRSRAVRGPFGLSEQIEDLAAVLDGRAAIVFGHSLGGDIALSAAERRPELVRAVGAYEPPMSWEPWWPPDTAGGDAVRVAAELGPEAACATFMRRMIGERLWDRLPAATRADREAEGVALVGELDDLRQRPPYDPMRIGVPVLLAYGERGARHHHDAAMVLGRRFGVGADNSRAELVEVPGVGHGIHLQQPQALADLVRRLAVLARAAESGLREP